MSLYQLTEQNYKSTATSLKDSEAKRYEKCTAHHKSQTPYQVTGKDPRLFQKH